MTRRKMISRRLLAASTLILTVVCFTACVGASPSDSSGDTDVLTQAQIKESNVTTNAYDFIQNERPHWLRVRGGISAVGDVALYVNGIRRRGRSIEGELKSIPVSSIQRISYLNSAEATGRYGTDHQHGAILVQTKGI